MPPLQDNTNRIINTRAEAIVETVINLYDKFWLKEELNKRKDVIFYLIECGMDKETAEYYTDQYNVH